MARIWLPCGRLPSHSWFPHRKFMCSWTLCRRCIIQANLVMEIEMTRYSFQEVIFRLWSSELWNHVSHQCLVADCNFRIQPWDAKLLQYISILSAWDYMMLHLRWPQSERWGWVGCRGSLYIFSGSSWIKSQPGHSLSCFCGFPQSSNAGWYLWIIPNRFPVHLYFALYSLRYW
jgi:hypothetical protein